MGFCLLRREDPDWDELEVSDGTTSSHWTETLSSALRLYCCLLGPIKEPRLLWVPACTPAPASRSPLTLRSPE